MTEFDHAVPEHVYIVGVGPGAPDLLTLRAANILRSVDVVLAPRSSASFSSLALRTVRDLLDEERQMVVEHIYPMKRDQQGTRACWEEAARTLLNHLFQGRSVAHITIGDPLIYSTSYYLLEALTEQIGSDRIHIVPGISAFQAVAARLGDTLTIQDDRMTIMSAADLSAVKQAVEACETLVLYKAGKRLDDLRRILGECGVLERAKAVFYAEQGDRETVVHDLQEDVPGTVGYMATVIVNTGRRYWTTRSE